MLIVLEGVDGAGKSTLAERLLSHLGEEHLRLHSGPLKGDPLKEYEWRLKDYEPGTGKHLVCDRWHVGELIYGPLYRGVSKLTGPMRTHVEMYLDKLGAHKMIVTAGYETIMQRLRSRGEDFLEAGHVGLVWDWYNEYAYRHGWQLVGSDELVSHVLHVARQKERDAMRLSQFRTYVGPVHPRHLLLGESQGKPHPMRPGYEQAFVPYPDTSGHFLLSALDSVGLRDYGIANAKDENVERLWHALGRPNVICLGTEAEKASRDVPHQTVHHPQYVRRFHHGDVKAYGAQIKELLRA